MTAPAPWRVKAFNTATTSHNKIHDDEVARSYGFAGGLVPGVDVYAYLTHVPVERWGIEFLERGAMSARFLQPVYDADEVTVEAIDEGDELALTLFDSRGESCATATATLASARPTDQIDIEAAPLSAEPPPASPALFAQRPVFGSLEFGFHADACRRVPTRRR